MSDGTLDIESIFLQAQQIEDPSGRSGFVRRACQGDASLEKLLLERLRISMGATFRIVAL
jgi:hypothetical protein